MTPRTAARGVKLTFFLILAGTLAAAFMPAGNALTPGGPANGADVAWMLTASALVLLMTPGLSFFYGGMVQPKNVISTMLQSFVAMAVVSLLWVAVGFSLAFGHSIGGIIGDPRTFFFFQHVGADTDPALAPTIPLILFALFQLKFAIITPALITGSFAERVRFSSYVLFMCLFTIFIYAPLAHWTWHPDGLLHKWGVLDFAGGTVVHMSAGFAALAGAIVLGRRRIHREHQSSAPANIPFLGLKAVRRSIRAKASGQANSVQGPRSKVLGPGKKIRGPGSEYGPLDPGLNANSEGNYAALLTINGRMSAITMSTSPNVQTMAAPVGRSNCTEKYIPSAETKRPITQPIARREPIFVAHSIAPTDGTIR